MSDERWAMSDAPRLAHPQHGRTRRTGALLLGGDDDLLRLGPHPLGHLARHACEPGERLGERTGEAQPDAAHLMSGDER